MLDTKILDRMELRQSGESVGGYTVVASEIVDAGDYDDLYKTVVKKKDGTFVQLFWKFRLAYDLRQYHMDEDGSVIAPKIVTPREVTVVVYE